jgi:anti-anti-sigma factor
MNEQPFDHRPEECCTRDEGFQMDVAPFAVGANWLEGTLRIDARGELDVASREEFNLCVHNALDHRFDRLVLDLAGLSFIDSVGLKSVLDLWNRSRKNGFTMTIVPGQRQVQRAFSLSGLDGVMPVEQASVQEPPEPEPAPAYMHCPNCRAVIEDTAGLLAGRERCPECRTPLELSPPSMFRGSVRHPGLAGGQPA